MTEREQFEAWAKSEGYDTAHTYDTDRSSWLFLSPMTADLWRAWQARAQTAQAVPPGYVLVPVEPTPEMLYAMHTESLTFYEDEQREAYRAMLAAAQGAKT